MSRKTIINRAPTPSLTKEELAIFQKCSDDILEFIKYIKIFNPARGWLNLDEVIFPKQKKILADIQKNWRDKYIVLLSPRQSSKTTLVLIFILWIVTFTSSANIAILANRKDNAKKIFRRFSGMYEKLPQMFRLSATISNSKTEMALDDGTIIFCGATSKSGLRSESLTFLYLDEFAFLPSPELQSDFWTANYPIMQSMSGGLVVSSTPRGKCLFFDLYRKTQKEIEGEPNPLYDPKWILERINWRDVDPRGKGRDEKWKQQTIRDLGVGGKNGAERFAQEFDNSFEIQAGIARFFNQEIIAGLLPKPPLFEWRPNKDYLGEPMKIFDQVADQLFLVGVDISEGKNLNFSTVVGLSIRKEKIDGEIDLDTFAAKQAFQFMHSGILPDDFFNFLFEFVITQLNDKWFMIFEINDVGRIFSLRFENLIAELTSNEFSKKNELFKQFLTDKFSGDNEQMINYLTRRVYRSLAGASKRSYIPWGLKVDRKNTVDLKNNLKTVVDKGRIKILDEYLLEEMRLFEDRRGKENINFPNYQGTSHFDLTTALKFSTWMLSDRSRMADVLSITALIESGYSRERQYLDAILGANSARTPRESLRRQMQMENEEELKSEGEVPLRYSEISGKDMGDLTSLWKPFKRLTYKK